jgi:hypothetical protein
VKELKAKSEEFEGKRHKSSLLRFFFKWCFAFQKVLKHIVLIVYIEHAT